MKEIGVDISNKKPKALTMEMIEKPDRMIIMGCGAEAEAVCPASYIQTEDWALEDPIAKPLEQVRKSRDKIKKRITNFAKETPTCQEI